MTTSKFTLVFSVTFAVAACSLTWLITGESSPFHNYFLDHLTLPNATLKLLVIPYVAVLMANSDTEFGDLVVAATVEFLQWLIVGFLLALFFNFVTRGPQTSRTKWLGK